ncbi:MAG: stage II sporulation protein R [Lachnospiraceae bacterium]|nr:stage II sporulation protein R [Lachnospiraceae bacterium]
MFHFYKKYLSANRVLILLLFCLLLIHASFLQANAVYARSASISDSVLRFRVIANSNSKEDQELKLAFKSRMCSALKPYLDDCADKETALSWIRTHMDFIRTQAEDILLSLTGTSDTRCRISLQTSFFPIRTYGSLTFPPGNYQTLLITLGNGQGKNWWCVLYPSLCFTDESTAGFSKEASERLKQSLSEGDYSSLKEGVTFRFRIAEIIGAFCEKNVHQRFF